MNQTQLGSQLISGELLLELLRKAFYIPEDATLLKIVPADNPAYCFQVVYTSKECLNVQEMNYPPINMTKRDFAGDTLREHNQ